MARYALVIGVGENQAPFRSLTKPIGDAQAIAQIFQKQGDFRVEVLTQPKQLQYKALVTAIQSFVQQRAAGDEALIYYTGHGFPLVKDFGETEAFLAPVDCSVTVEGAQITAQRNGLSLASLNRFVAKASFSNLVMLLDCCHSGYLLEDDLLRQTFADFSRKDYWLMTACRSFEQAWANKHDSHSVFTGAILAGLSRDRADERGVITAGSLFEFVQRTLRSEQQEVLQLAVGRPIELLRFPLEQPSATVDESLEPYQGLNAFTPETAQFFFGREDEIQSLVQQVHTHRFVPLIGASGSGKSSLVRAGLVPRLQELGWRVLEPIKPGSHPLVALKLALRSVFAESEIAGVYERIDRQDLVTVSANLPEPQRWLLVVDQFEEVFTLCADRVLQAAFIQTLTSVGQLKMPRLTIVTTMRADFVEPWLAYGELTTAIQSQAMFLGGMTREGLEAAIVQPAKRLNYQVQARLLAEILHDVETEANSLPLLQFALQQVWQQRDRGQRELTHAAYQQLGGVAGALNQKAETIYHQLEAAGQGDWVRRVLLKLIRTGEGTKDTRQRRLKAELLEMAEDPPKSPLIRGTLSVFGSIPPLIRGGRGDQTVIALNARDLTQEKQRQTISSIIATLVDGRLLVSDRINHQDVIDLSHEALIQRWQRLATWREQDRDLRRLVDKIEDAQREWLQQGKKRQDLLQGRLLKDARRLLNQPAEVARGTKAFIQQSLRWRWTQLAATLLVPVLILGVPAEYFWREEAVKRDYARLESPSKPEARSAVISLTSGCWAKKQYQYLQTYFRERVFGNCQPLRLAKLEKADLRDANLSGADLSGANLSGADLSGANLSGADLRDANLSGAKLWDANLSGADLRGAKLSGVSLPLLR
jgi:energy-coupling factor transporter ATP-binding protein EcfA2